MKLLDLFCGAGGCAMGYYRVGFTEIVGIDIEPQKRYPFEFVQGDALEFVAKYGHEFDMIHASPPCQVYSVTAPLSNAGHPDLVRPTREALQATGKPYIIENVIGAPLTNAIMLCGTMFQLRVIRHRLFECNPYLWMPPAQCKHTGKIGNQSLVINGKRVINSFDHVDILCIAGHNFRASDARVAMDINWMSRDELSQAIPPAYTEWLGKEILKLI
jgi:DNA (cytosine-5)-methyltransferase 1